MAGEERDYAVGVGVFYHEEFSVAARTSCNPDLWMVAIEEYGVFILLFKVIHVVQGIVCNAFFYVFYRIFSRGFGNIDFYAVRLMRLKPLLEYRVP